MQDGKGALYFVKPQATKLTRQEMREKSPSGNVDMQPWLGRSFDALTITMTALFVLVIAYIVDFSLM